MAMAADSNSTEEFTLWLKEKLVDLNTDDEVFSPYILGILETDDNDEEKFEALIGILSEITENDTNGVCTEILKKWSEALEKVMREEEKNTVKVNVDEKLAKLMEESKRQPLQVVSTTTAEQQKLKEAILAQYAQVSDGELSEENGEVDSAVRTSSLGLTKNTNVESVARAEREKREKEKGEAQKKRDKDKEDRAKQRARDEERKEKEKKRTQKGERRR